MRARLQAFAPRSRTFGKLRLMSYTQVSVGVGVRFNAQKGEGSNVQVDARLDEWQPHLSCNPLVCSLRHFGLRAPSEGISYAS